MNTVTPPQTDCLSAEIPRFVPTREELLHLAAYWTRFALEEDFDKFTLGWYQLGGFRGHIGWRRVNEIAACLGDVAVDEVVALTTEEFSKTVNPELWRLWHHGTPDEVLAMEEDFERKLHGEDCAREHRERELRRRVAWAALGVQPSDEALVAYYFGPSEEELLSAPLEDESPGDTTGRTAVLSACLGRDDLADAVDQQRN